MHRATDKLEESAARSFGWKAKENSDKFWCEVCERGSSNNDEYTIPSYLGPCHDSDENIVCAFCYLQSRDSTFPAQHHDYKEYLVGYIHREQEKEVLSKIQQGLAKRQQNLEERRQKLENKERELIIHQRIIQEQLNALRLQRKKQDHRRIKLGKRT